MKKVIWIFLFIAFSHIGFTQEANFPCKIANHTIKINNCDNFSCLDKILKDKRIVVLGESDHNEGTSFEIKVKLVKYMVNKLGFDIVGLEGLNFSTSQLFPKYWEEISPDIKEKLELQEFNINDLWPPLWSYTNECQSLVSLINDNKISVLGIDYFGDVFSTDFFRIMTNSISPNSWISIDFDRFENFYWKTLISYSSGGRCEEVNTDEHLYFLEILMTIKNIAQKEFHIGKEKRKAAILLQGIKNTEALYRGYLLAQKKQISDEDRLTYGNNFRDQQMADNVIWYLEHNPKKKIIIWCANLHGVRNLTQAERLWPSLLMYSETKFMGEYLYEKYGDQFYSLAFISSEWENGDKADETSLEYHIAAKGYDYGFIDFSPLRYQDEYFNKIFQAYILTRNRAKWLNMFDGVYFIRQQKQSTFIKR